MITPETLQQKKLALEQELTRWAVDHGLEAGQQLRVSISMSILQEKPTHVSLVMTGEEDPPSSDTFLRAGTTYYTRRLTASDLEKIMAAHNWRGWHRDLLKLVVDQNNRPMDSETIFDYLKCCGHYEFNHFIDQNVAFINSYLRHYRFAAVERGTSRHGPFRFFVVKERAKKHRRF